MKTLLYVCITSLLFTCCNDRKSACFIGDNLGRIDFCTDSFYMLPNNNQDVGISNYIYIIYLDSVECMGCIANKFAYWKNIEKKAKNIDSTFNVCFVIDGSEKMINNAKKVFYYSSYSPVVFIDSLGSFKNNNKEFLKCFPGYKMFLLDKKRNVKLIGDPILNSAIEQKLYKIVGGGVISHK